MTNPLRVLAVFLTLLLIQPLQAQAPTHTPITSENIDTLEEISSVGGELIGELAWSEDSSLLAVGSSSQTTVYRISENPEFVSRFAGRPEVHFNSVGEVVNGTGRYVPETGHYRGEPLMRSPSGRYLSLPPHVDATHFTVIDTQTSQTFTLETDEPSGFDLVIFSPDETRLALISQGDDLYTRFTERSGHDQAIVQLWTLGESPERLMLETLNRSYVHFAAFTADRARFVVSSYQRASMGMPSKEVRIYEGQDGRLLVSNEQVRYEGVPVVHPTIQLIAYAGDHSIDLYAAENEVHLTVGEPLGHGGLPSGNLHARSFAASHQALYEFYNLTFSPSGALLAASGYTSVENKSFYRVMIWTVEGALQGEPPITFIETDSIAALAFSPDETQLLTIGGLYDGVHTGVMWQLDDGSQVTEFTDLWGNAHFSQDGTRIISHHPVRGYAFHDAATGELLKTTPPGVISPNERWLAQTVRGQVWVHDTDTASLNERAVILNPIPDYLGPLTAFSADGGIAVFEAEQLRCFDILIPEQICTFPSLGSVMTSQSMSQDGRFWVGMTGSARVRAYNTRYNTTPVFSDEPEEGTPIFWFSPDGRLLFRMYRHDGFEGTMVVKDLEEDGPEPAIEVGTLVHSPVFSRDGRWMILSSSERFYQDDSWLLPVLIYDLQTENFDNPIRLSISLSNEFSASETIERVVLSGDDRWLAIERTTQVLGDGPSVVSFNTLVWPLDALLENPEMPPGVFHGLHHVQVDAQRGVIYGYQNETLGQWPLAAAQEYSTRYVSSPIGYKHFDLPLGRQLALSPDGSVLAVRQDDRVAIWDAATVGNADAAPLWMLDVPELEEIAFNTDGSVFYIRTTGGVTAYGVE